MTFAKRLRELREQAGLTQEQLARAADMSVGNVRNYEQGIREPRWQGVFQLAEALGVDCSAFKVCMDGGPAEAALAPRKRGKK
jgi:transcriptional regulator with XRE-family HTH domain